MILLLVDSKESFVREGYEVVFDSLRMVVKKKNLNYGREKMRGRLDDDGL